MTARGPWTRADHVLALVLAASAFAPRAALRGHGIFDIDSALLTLGVRSFDFASYHPHPPYHPLSMGAAKLLAPFVGPADALTWLSLGSVAVLAWAVFGIGRALGGRLVGVHAALLLALSALVTEDVGVALTYANEPAALAVTALLALRARARPDWRSWAMLGAAASVAVGVRPSAAIVAGPLILWAARRDLRGLLQAVAAGAGTLLLWLPATLVAGGGWSMFAFGNRFQSRLYVLHDPVWRGGLPALHNNLAWLAYHLRTELPWLALVGLLAATAAFPLWLRRGPTRGFLLAWGGPTLLFYGLVYGGWPSFHSGYALGILPPALVAAALALRNVHGAVAERVTDRPLRATATVVVVLVAALPGAWPLAWHEVVQPRRDVEAWSGSWAGLEDALPPEHTALLGGYSAHWALTEHPRYLTWVVELAMADDGRVYLQVAQSRDSHFDKAYFDNIRDGLPDASHPIPAGIDEIVLVTGHPLEGGSFPLTQMPVKRVVVLPGGAHVAVYDAHAVPTIEDAITNYGQMWPHPDGRVWPPA